VKLGFGGFAAKSMIGLDIGSSSVKAVEIATKGRGNAFELTHMGVAKLPRSHRARGLPEFECDRRCNTRGHR
jgi:Tfp pilus assembly PilM family ATPase